MIYGSDGLGFSAASPSLGAWDLVCSFMAAPRNSVSMNDDVVDVESVSTVLEKSDDGDDNDEGFEEEEEALMTWMLLFLDGENALV